mgnify:CR=1 FL=1
MTTKCCTRRWIGPIVLEGEVDRPPPMTIKLDKGGMHKPMAVKDPPRGVKVVPGAGRTSLLTVSIVARRATRKRSVGKSRPIQVELK